MMLFLILDPHQSSIKRNVISVQRRRVIFSASFQLSTIWKETHKESSVAPYQSTIDRDSDSQKKIKKSS